MIYRILARLAFEDEADLDDIRDKIEDAFYKAITINPDTEQAEPSFYMVEECHHQGPHPAPCEVVEEHHTN